MKVSFLDIAELELHEAYLYYESEQPNLELRFCEEVAQAVDRNVEQPKAYQDFSARTRRCLVARFPYGILYEYQEAASEILVVSISHLRRGPEHWASRER